MNATVDFDIHRIGDLVVYRNAITRSGENQEFLFGIIIKTNTRSLPNGKPMRFWVVHWDDDMILTYSDVQIKNFKEDLFRP